MELAKHIQLFWEKRQKLAWTLLNIMNNVHHYQTLHNDISPNNVLLHFPPNSPNEVYIGICDGSMAGNFSELKESLYIHESEVGKSRTMRNMR
jgi:hypothetical protein